MTAEPGDWDAVFDALLALRAAPGSMVSTSVGVDPAAVSHATALAAALEEADVPPPAVSGLPDGRAQLSWAVGGDLVEAEVGGFGRWCVRQVESAAADADADAENDEPFGSGVPAVALGEQDMLGPRRALHLLVRLLGTGLA